MTALEQAARALIESQAWIHPDREFAHYYGFCGDPNCEQFVVFNRDEADAKPECKHLDGCSVKALIDALEGVA